MNDEALLAAITEISKAISEPSIFDIIALIISVLSLFATIIVMILNYRAVKAAKESVEVAEKSVKLAKLQMEKSVDAQLYEKRLEIANLIEKNDYSSSITEIALLFGDEVYRRVKEIQYTISLEGYQKRRYNEYKKMLKEREFGQEYDELWLQGTKSPESLSPEQLARYQELDAMYGILVSYYWQDGEEKEDQYDIHRITSELEELELEIKRLQKELKETVLAFMKEKLEVKPI